MGFDVNSSSLSAGQLKMVDFAVLLAFIKLMKIKFPSLNVIFLDEIFSSIDPNNRYKIISILRTFSKKLKLNIFVVNHSELPNELFDYVLKVDRDSGFSNIDIEEIK